VVAVRDDDIDKRPLANVRVPWHRPARRIAELTANENVKAVVRRSWRGGFS